ncbi:hypothetical protein NPIL_461581 [Nephila pilipes]|uniref:Uncharacterized protein n=1 Tax=Nephila pilipes TaxID=299642 RepID=A0A8X6R6L9_NEPPI|nr:hypothetical protein NPIL_461581 [Nephila pilipes]
MVITKSMDSIEQYTTACCKLASRKVYINLSDNNDLPAIQKSLFHYYKVENTNNEELETPIQEEGNRDSDTDTSENVERHKEDSCRGQNDADSNSDECDDVRQE